MAMSTLLRSSLCMNKALGTQAFRIATRSTSIPRMVSENVGVRLPLVSAVRCVKTLPIPSSAKGSDHSKIWVVEKAVSALLVGLVPAALLFPNKTLDTALAVAVVAHTFWGFEAIAVDYVRPIIFGNFIPKLAVGAVYLMSFATLGGLFYIIQHDVGIANSIRQLWTVGSNKTA